MRYSLTFLPLNVTMLQKALVSLKRIRGYLDLEQIGARETSDSMSPGIGGSEFSFEGPYSFPSESRSAILCHETRKRELRSVLKEVECVISGEDINFTDYSFSWGEATPVLSSLNFSIKKGELVAVVGRVGSGKSSLLNAILGETKRLSGVLNVRRSVC